MMSLPPATRDNDYDSSSSTTPKHKKYTRPLSAYAIFYEEQRATMLLACLKNKTMTLKEVTKVMDNTIKDCRHRKKQGKIGRRDIKMKVQAMWRSMSASQRDLYEVASQQQVQQCQAQLKAWRASQQENQEPTQDPLEIPYSSGTVPQDASSIGSDNTIATFLKKKLTNNNNNTSTATTDNNFLFLPFASTVHYGECESEDLSLHGGSINGSLAEETNSCSSAPMSFTYQTTTSDDTATLHHNKYTPSSNTMDSTIMFRPQEEIQYVQQSQHNYVDLSSHPVVEEPHHHPLTNNINHTNPDDEDLTNNNTDVEDLALQLDVEAVAFICSTFNS